MKKPQHSHDKLTVDYDRDDIENSLPNLAKELTSRNHPNIINIDSIEIEKNEESNREEMQPSVIGFLRRCRTKEEAVEIITFLAEKSQITKEEKEIYLEKLEKEGIRSFGSLKTWGFYERQYRRKNPDTSDFQMNADDS
jgi:hypothetical protein